MPNYNVTVALGSGGTGLPTGVYNVMAYGAAGDGSTDDTAAIQACFDAVEAAGGGEIYFPNKTFRTTATLKLENPNNDEFYKVKLGQATIVADASLGGPILELGDQAEQHYHIDVEGGWLTMASRDWTDTVGLQLNNVNSSNIAGASAKWCEKGLELTSVTGTDSCAYNTINMRHISDCLHGIYVECDGLNANGGWVNENTFVGDTRISYSSGLSAVDCSSGVAIFVGRQNTEQNRPNGQTFVGLSLEWNGGTTYPPPKAFSGDIAYGVFTGIRVEGFSRSYSITGATQASPCVVTIGAHTVQVGDSVHISGISGMEDLDGYYAVEAAGATTASLTVDASGFDAWTSGGTAYMGDYLNFESGSSYNEWIGGYLPGGRSYLALPRAQSVRCSFRGGRENSLVGGHGTDVPALAIRSNSSGYASLGIYKTFSTDPEYMINDDGDVTVDSVRQVKRIVGSGSPEGVVSANRGSIFQRRDGGLGQGLYIKDAGSDATGWRVYRGLLTAATADDTTPTVADIRFLKTPSNTVATAITQLDDGVASQEVTIICFSSTNSSTITDGGNFRLSGNWTPTTYDTLTLFTNDGSTWIETARSNN